MTLLTFRAFLLLHDDRTSRFPEDRDLPLQTRSNLLE